MKNYLWTAANTKKKLLWNPTKLKYRTLSSNIAMIFFVFDARNIFIFYSLVKKCSAKKVTDRIGILYKISKKEIVSNQELLQELGLLYHNVSAILITLLSKYIVRDFTIELYRKLIKNIFILMKALLTE